MKTPEQIAQSIITACADCDTCRFLMDSNCLMFPELYRLYDKEVETGKKAGTEELRRLVDQCNYCALCPCPNIREDLIRAKTEFIQRDGLKFGVHALEDVDRLGRLFGLFPRMVKSAMNNPIAENILKSVLDVHKERSLPQFASENFDNWLKKQSYKETGGVKGKVAYFAGCTGRYLFPEVPKAVIEVLQHNAIEVYYPDQRCCGMPSMLEGDQKLTLQFVRANLEFLTTAIDNGYDILCSCPTCGYFFKFILQAGAYYSTAYQEAVGADKDHIKVPLERSASGCKEKKYNVLQKVIYDKVLKDDGYFSALDPLKRIAVSERIYDLGEYLSLLLKQGRLNTRFGRYHKNMIYYPPCHQREQGIGSPYMELLHLIPGSSIESVDWSLYCCGMAGIMGFKKEFHQASIQLGEALMKKIHELKPELIVTDCLSCRLQFNHQLPYPVAHPVEILQIAYAA